MKMKLESLSEVDMEILATDYEEDQIKKLYEIPIMRAYYATVSVTAYSLDEAERIIEYDFDEHDFGYPFDDAPSNVVIDPSEEISILEIGGVAKEDAHKLNDTDVFNT